MPYLKVVDINRAVEGKYSSTDYGIFNWLFTKAIIKVWTINPGYATIHKLKSAVEKPYYVYEIQEVDELLKTKGINDRDRLTARKLAFDEFMRRIGNRYEDLKAKENGDVYANVPLIKKVEVPVNEKK